MRQNKGLLKFSLRKRMARGFSLTEIMVAIAILSVITLGIAGAVSGMLKAQMMVSDKDEGNEFAAALGRYLYTEAACSAALLNTSFPTVAGAKVPAVIMGYQGYGATAPTVNVSTGMEIGQRMRIKQLNLVNKGTPPTSVTIQTTGLPLNYMRYVAQIELLMERRDDGNWMPSAPRYYEFPVLIDPLDLNRIKRCATQPTNLDYCNITGGTLVVKAGVEVCEPAPGTQCFIRGAYATSVCSPSKYKCTKNMPNPVTGSVSCPAGAAAIQSGYMETVLKTSCGKKCSVKVKHMTTFYICQECK